MQEFRPVDWCYDPYQKQCAQCDTVIGRYAVLVDDDGLRNVLFWPHREWDGVDGSSRCRKHSEEVGQQWLRLF